MYANKFIKTIGLLLGLWSLNSQGSAIYFNAIDLADVNPAEDLWRYEYQIDGTGFLQNDGFDISFSIDDGYLFGDLSGATAANPDWDVLAIQPDPLLPHDGFLDGLASGNNPSLQGYFSIDFIWRGTGTPGQQDYQFYAANLDITGRGQTQPFPNTSVPEPATLLLMSIGLGGYFGYRIKSIPVNKVGRAPLTCSPLWKRGVRGNFLNKSPSTPLFQRGKLKVGRAQAFRARHFDDQIMEWLLIHPPPAHHRAWKCRATIKLLPDLPGSGSSNVWQQNKCRLGISVAFAQHSDVQIDSIDGINRHR